MTSSYKRDLGNGVVVYADQFVNTGKWVFDCSSSRLIHRQPLPAPIVELEKYGKLTIQDMNYFDENDINQAKTAIKAIAGIEGWYKKLNYRYSYINENSELDLHIFDIIARHGGQLWAMNVWQILDKEGRSSFELNAEPYDPDAYVDYLKAFEDAVKSCRVPQ